MYKKIKYHTYQDEQCCNKEIDTFYNEKKIEKNYLNGDNNLVENITFWILEVKKIQS